MTPVRTATRTILPEIKAGWGTGIALTPDGKTLYVFNGSAHTITPVSTATGKAGAPIKFISAPIAIAFGR